MSRIILACLCVMNLIACKTTDAGSRAQSLFIESGNDEGHFLYLSTDNSKVCLNRCAFGLQHAVTGANADTLAASCEFQGSKSLRELEKMRVPRQDSLKLMLNEVRSGATEFKKAQESDMNLLVELKKSLTPDKTGCTLGSAQSPTSKGEKQRFTRRYIKVVNKTSYAIKVKVRYQTLHANGKAYWYVGYWDIHPRQETYLGDHGFTVNAFKAYVHAWIVDGTREGGWKEQLIDLSEPYEAEKMDVREVVFES